MLVGKVGAWLGHFRTLEERMAETIEAVWPVCIAPLHEQKGAMTHEDHITNHLVQALIKSKRVPGRIIPQYSLLTEAANQRTTLSSNIDFVLTIGDDEAVYLACECKRLNVPYRKRIRGTRRRIRGRGIDALCCWPIFKWSASSNDAGLRHECAARRGTAGVAPCYGRSVYGN